MAICSLLRTDRSLNYFSAAAGSVSESSRLSGPCGRVRISGPVREPLALHAEQGRLSASGIINAQRDPVVVTELEFRQITAQVLLIAMLIDALHAALEKSEEALDSVGVNSGILKRDILANAVVDGAVAGSFLANLDIVLCFIGHQPRLVSNALANDPADFLAGHVVDMDSLHLAAALDQRQHGMLVAGAALRGRNTLLAAGEGLIRLHGVAEAPAISEWPEAVVAHRLADAVAKEPRALECDPKYAVELVAADALLRAAKQMDGLEPFVEGNVAALEDGPDLHREGLVTVVALAYADAGALALQALDAIRRPAVRAGRTVRPQPRLDPPVGGNLVVEAQFGKNGHGNLHAL
jgi:hypothetical protein